MNNKNILPFISCCFLLNHSRHRCLDLIACSYCRGPLWSVNSGDDWPHKLPWKEYISLKHLVYILNKELITGIFMHSITGIFMHSKNSISLERQIIKKYDKLQFIFLLK